MPRFKACWSCLVLSLGILQPSGIAAQTARDTLSVYFDLDAAALSSTATRYLDSLVYRGLLQRGSDVALVGYTDYLGSAGYNDTLSLRRAKAVKAYLLQSGFRSSDIRLLLARGEVPRADESSREGFATDRRVDVVLVTRPPATRPNRMARTGNTADTPRASAFTATFEPAPPRRPAPPKRVELPAKPVRKPQPVTAKKTPVEPPKTDFSGLSKADSATTLRIENLYFPMGRHTPYEASFVELDRLFNTLQAQPSLHIRVEGHVCCINGALVPDALDEETAEYRLSVNRARFITEYLIRKGINPGRLQYVGFGKTRPIEPVELTAEDGNRNRRVEVRVLQR